MIPRRSSHSDGVPYSSSSLPGSSSRSLYMGGCSSHQGGLRVSSNVSVTPDFPQSIPSINPGSHFGYPSNIAMSTMGMHHSMSTMVTPPNMTGPAVPSNF